MEVHRHSHTSRKKWTHYFWEFLMLFLAVFCGFLAELQVEHKIESTREREYINSMIEDLETDTLNLNLMHVGFNKIEARLDSVICGFNEGVKTYSPVWTKLFTLSYRGGFPDFFYSDRTIQQLKNSGGMRIIKKEKAAAGIIDYDAAIKDLNKEESFVSMAQDRYVEEVMKIWSVNKMLADAGTSSWAKARNMEIRKNYWITSDPVAYEHLFNRLSEYNESIIRQNRIFLSIKAKATVLINLLKEEYHLE